MMLALTTYNKVELTLVMPINTTIKTIVEHCIEGKEQDNSNDKKERCLFLLFQNHCEDTICYANIIDASDLACVIDHYKLYRIGYCKINNWDVYIGGHLSSSYVAFNGKKTIIECSEATMPTEDGWDEFEFKISNDSVFWILNDKQQMNLYLKSVDYICDLLQIEERKDVFLCDSIYQFPQGIPFSNLTEMDFITLLVSPQFNPMLFSYNRINHLSKTAPCIFYFGIIESNRFSVIIRRGQMIKGYSFKIDNTLKINPFSLVSTKSGRFVP